MRNGYTPISHDGHPDDDASSMLSFAAFRRWYISKSSGTRDYEPLLEKNSTMPHRKFATSSRPITRFFKAILSAAFVVSAMLFISRFFMTYNLSKCEYILFFFILQSACVTFSCI